MPIQNWWPIGLLFVGFFLCRETLMPGKLPGVVPCLAGIGFLNHGNAQAVGPRRTGRLFFYAPASCPVSRSPSTPVMRTGRVCPRRPGMGTLTST